MKNRRTSGIVGIAHSLGSINFSNERLEKENPKWDMSKTKERTGISCRTIAQNDETAVDMAELASRSLLDGITELVGDIDGLIFCTQTPDHIIPGNASLLHGRLGLTHDVMAFDINHACAGYLYGIGLAQSLVESKALQNVLVVTGDTYSRLVHPKDRSVRAIFGDGATATLYSSTNAHLKLVDIMHRSAGSKADRFMIQNGGMKSPYDPGVNIEPDKNQRVASPNHIQMDGLGILSFFNSNVPKLLHALLGRNSMDLSEVDKFVFHQASKMAIDGIVRSLKLDETKVVRDFEYSGNLVSSSIPVALSNLVMKPGLKSGEKVVLCGFGAGLSWSAGLLEVT